MNGSAYEALQMVEWTTRGAIHLTVKYCTTTTTTVAASVAGLLTTDRSNPTPREFQSRRRTVSIVVEALCLALGQRARGDD